MGDEKSLNLRPTLSLFDATAINIGAIIGAGIFVVTGIVAGLAGSALMVSLLLAAVVGLFTALSFADLSANYPTEGGGYEFAHILISPLAGFIAGWMWVIANVFVGAAVALGFSHYLASMFPVLPIRPTAIIIISLLTISNIVGAKTSAELNNVLVIAKILILGFFVALGSQHIAPHNLMPFEPFQPGVLYGAYYIFFAFTGFGRISLLAQEVKNARQNVPKAIVLSLIISTIIYLAVGFVAIGLLGGEGLQHSDSPLAAAISATGSTFAIQIVSAGGVIATASVLLTTILGVSRLTYAMAANRDLPAVLGRLHPRYDTPYFSVVVSSALMILLVFVSGLNEIVAVSTLATLVYYAIGDFAATRLKPGERRYPRFIPVLGVLSCVAFLVFVLFHSPVVWIIGIGILLVGLGYFRFANRRMQRRGSGPTTSIAK